MSIKLAINGFKDPCEGLDWDEQANLFREDLSRLLEGFPDARIELKITDGRRGTSSATVTITVS